MPKTEMRKKVSVEPSIEQRSALQLARIYVFYTRERFSIQQDEEEIGKDQAQV